MLDQQTLRQRILEITNMIVTLEGGPMKISDVRIVPAPAFFDSTYGTSIHREEDGTAILRISTKRPVDEVANTILHETAHVLLGPDHVDGPDHAELFQKTYRRIWEKYFDVVLEEITRP